MAKTAVLGHSTGLLKLQDYPELPGKPQLPEVKQSNGSWVCANCGVALRNAHDWCGPCLRSWEIKKKEWHEKNETRFAQWFETNKNHIEGFVPEEKPDIVRRGLTKREERKLGWYRNEKKWLEDIGKRRQLPNGDVAIVDHKGRIEEVRKKDEV